MTPRIAAMPNFRDAGGHGTSDGGTMRPGLLYRSDNIAGLSAADAAALAGLGILVVYDLRTGAERELAPGDAIPGATRISLDLMADDRQAAPAQLLRLLEHPRAAKSVLGDGRAAALFVEGYRAVVTLPSARTGLGRLYRGLVADDGLPALCHCTTGKDRTGWACAALQAFLGVPFEEVLGDFLASNRNVLPKYRPRVEEFAARGGDPALLEPVLGVTPEYLEAAFGEVRRIHDSIEGYFDEGLGLDSNMRRSLRDRFVASP